MPLRLVTPTLLSLLSLLLSACGGRAGHTLDSIHDAITRDPEAALACLDTLDTQSYMPEERLTYDFLRVKATDKAEKSHQSDSLILRVVGLCERRGDPRLTEALYLAGRVYLDLGDFTSALKYYHKALDRLPADTDDPILRGTVMGNIAYVLNSMNLPGEATPYMEEVVRTDSILADTVNWVYDLEMLADCRFTADSIQKAREIMTRARQLAAQRGMKDTVHEDNCLAYYALYLDGPEAALALLRKVSEQNIPAISLPSFYVRAAEIYLDNDLPDTAAMYARKLIDADSFFNSRIGYLTMLSPKLRGLLPVDSVYRYVEGYSQQTEDYINGVLDRSTLIQNGQYNYSLHERERRKAEMERDDMRIWLMAAMAVAGILLLVLGWHSFRRFYERQRILALTEMIRRMVTDLRLAESVAESMRRSLPGGARTGARGAETPPEEPLMLPDRPKPYPEETRRIGIEAVMERSGLNMESIADVEDRRMIIREKIMDALDSVKGKAPVDAALRCGQAASRIKEYLVQDKAIDEDHALWEMMIKEITAISPDFFRSLYVLCRGVVTRQEMEGAVLVKMGIRPKDMETLLGRTKGAVSSRRITLGARIFDCKVSLTIIDNLLRIL